MTRTQERNFAVSSSFSSCQLQWLYIAEILTFQYLQSFRCNGTFVEHVMLHLLLKYVTALSYSCLHSSTCIAYVHRDLSMLETITYIFVMLTNCEPVLIFEPDASSI